MYIWVYTCVCVFLYEKHKDMYELTYKKAETKKKQFWRIKYK